MKGNRLGLAGPSASRSRRCATQHMAYVTMGRTTSTQLPLGEAPSSPNAPHSNPKKEVIGETITTSRGPQYGKGRQRVYAVACRRSFRSVCEDTVTQVLTPRQKLRRRCMHAPSLPHLTSPACHKVTARTFTRPSYCLGKGPRRFHDSTMACSVRRQSACNTWRCRRRRRGLPICLSCTVPSPISNSIAVACSRGHGPTMHTSWGTASGGQIHEISCTRPLSTYT